MTLEKRVNNGRLIIKKEGTICANLGNIRGINPFYSCGERATPSKAIIVKYNSSAKISEAEKPDGEFIFYGSLPEDIEGWEFVFTERYSGQDKNTIPLEQYLIVFGPNSTWQDFAFSRD